MKKIIIALTTLVLFLLPLTVYAQSVESSKNVPPISQTLVPEGDFALKLVPALGLGTPNNEAQAEDMLTSVGIAPKNGWIAEYPVTPDIVGELQDTVGTAADSKKLPMAKEDALKAFQDLTTEFGLAVVPGGPGQYAENQPQLDPAAVNNYYYEEGPPVVTYYPPPWDYDYLYAWVPYPFWWNGFFFSGFFCLHDFHRVVFVGHHRFVVSNHFFSTFNRAVVRVDPVSRATGRGFRTTDISHHRGFNSVESRRGATSIFERSRGSTSARASGSDRSVRHFGNFDGRNNLNSSAASSTGESRSFRGPGATGRGAITSPSTAGRNLGASESPRGSSGVSGRTFSAPSGGGSSACANCHGNSGSFGRSAGGGGSGGFSSSRSSGGSSGGHFSGGSSGGHFSGGSSGGGGGHGGGGRGR